MPFLQTNTGTAETPTLGRALAGARRTHRDGELAVVSEVANPDLRNRLANRLGPPHESAHFAVFSVDGETVVLHRLSPERIDNDLAELVAAELVRPGHVALANAFERCFAGVVLSSGPDPASAWRTFYSNTLRRLESGLVGREVGGPGPVAEFAGIYARARSLLLGFSLLDVGTCFGFFPLLLRRLAPDLRTTALDLSEPLLSLARSFAASENAETSGRFVRGDACALPFGNASFDTVTALHLVEHLPPEAARRALGEMCRVARRRVVVAVPLESEPDPAYGHLQSFERESLLDLAGTTGWRGTFEEYRGGWLVLEPPGAAKNTRHAMHGA
ncbi:Methyltransferase domain [Rubrobacter radiotolerans]|uniref:Methyltransferase domain n=1 Tax=Rubrobacter radiotolerans TaxID=42256 RepID=A0A023X795_RUBRA|nr:mycofactocin oligosaccharide methyltransferase MftM [Rubrobacter radiotolerans]AHY47915.1 Methyltransferase domain [Rubrobacter radiotolerans]MDX5892554.1 mycofactocin oligosaccharide methyltransferase MftM [Rubrobacter radiotolerans]SMC07843.1 Methyltransferase domain-containing protein [Rubrobacter radiotolerans DSM 5868]